MGIFLLPFFIFIFVYFFPYFWAMAISSVMSLNIKLKFQILLSVFLFVFVGFCAIYSFIININYILFLAGFVIGTPFWVFRFYSNKRTSKVRFYIGLVATLFIIWEMEVPQQIIFHALTKDKTMYDIEILKETGFCHGIENYSRHMSLRDEGETPTTLIDFFPDDFLLVIDESHVTLPQVRGMYNGDHMRKQTLVDYGFRLPSAMDNRPLKFDEFKSKLNQVIYVSATPGDYELSLVDKPVEQIIRPTGLLDPLIDVRPTKNQIDNIIEEINDRISKNERVLITTLTIRMSEELTTYLKELGYKVTYLHNEIKTLERLNIIRNLRLGKIDVVVGINLLREGIDIPEVSLICIMDADKQGFLRSDRSLIQTIGRAARNQNGKVIMYADTMSDAMKIAISETNRRRAIQEKYNKEHNIIPKTVVKDIKEAITNEVEEEKIEKKKYSKRELNDMIHKLEIEMKEAASRLDFERATELRDVIFELKDLN